MINFIDLKKINKNIKKICPTKLKKFLREIQPQKINIQHAKELFVKKSGFINKIDEIETLVLGSSHGDYGFNPEFFDKIAYNLCYASQDFYYSYKLYQNFYNKIPKTKNILLFYSVFSAGLELDKTTEYPMCSYYKLLFGIPYKTNNKSYTKFERQLNKNNFGHLNTSAYYLGYNNPQFFFGEDYGVINRVKTHLRENQRKNNQTEYINKIFELSKQANHDLTVIIPPARNDYKNNLPDSDFLFEELYNISKNKFNILNFYNDKDFLFDDFGDFDHLNYNGAIKLTQKIREYLK